MNYYIFYDKSRIWLLLETEIGFLSARLSLLFSVWSYILLYNITF